MRRNKLFNSNEEDSGIDISPLLDMVFILLIFFVVTTTFTRQTGVEVKKPKAATASKVKEKVVLVGITREGTIHIYEKQVDLEVLETILSREKIRYPNMKVVIVSDEKSFTGRLVEVIDIASLAGVTDVSIAATED